MPELRGRTFPDFVEETVDTNSIRFKDKNRERQRQKALAELKNKESSATGRRNFSKNKAWSKQKSKKDRRKKMATKRKLDEGSDVDEDDVQELLNDTRLLKKLKRGKISEEDFEKQVTAGQRRSGVRATGPSQGHDSGSGDEM